MNYYTYNQKGKILKLLELPEFAVDFQILEEGEILTEGVANPEEQYIDIPTKTLVDFPIKPNEYSVFNWDIKQWEDDTSIEIDRIDKLRILLLMSSDWTDTVSAVTRLGQDKYNEWQVYRQALRDIPSQEGYPLNVVFPTQPN